MEDDETADKSTTYETPPIDTTLPTTDEEAAFAADSADG